MTLVIRVNGEVVDDDATLSMTDDGSWTLSVNKQIPIGAVTVSWKNAAFVWVSAGICIETNVESDSSARSYIVSDGPTYKLALPI